VPIIKKSASVVRALLEAEDISKKAAQPLSSTHLLLALFTFQNRAQILLEERGVDEDRLLSHIHQLDEEPQGTVFRIRDRARDIAISSQSESIDCLHLLIALTRLRDCFAYRVLQRTGLSLTSLRNIAVSYVTGNMPRRFKSIPPPPSPSTLVQRSRQISAPQVLDREPELQECEEDEFSFADAIIEHSPEQLSQSRSSLEATTTDEKHHVESFEQSAPALSACGVNLTALAKEGKLDDVIGRESEVERLIDILGKRRANNPILLGSPGVGKTAIVEGFAFKIARGDSDVEHFRNRTIFSLDTGALVAGTSLRGAFSERLAAIKAEVAAAQGAIIVFIDEIHTLMGAGSSGDGPQDAANELKTALARGDFPCIGATTHDEFKKHIEKDPALERRFDPIMVEEPSEDEAILILEHAMGPYADHHGINYSLEAVHAAVKLSHRFISERKLPDKAFALIDLAGSRARRRNADIVNRHDVAKIVAEWTGVPLERMSGSEQGRIQQAETFIAEKFIGHPNVLKAVCASIRRGFAGLNKRRPMGSFLFLGPTGVGKTELAKLLAEFLFGKRDAMVRIDMSELSEKHAVSRLVGAQPGYVGFEQGGQLTEALRKRPFQVVLFDEIEKAHSDVWNLLLQVLDEGHLTDNQGHRVSFANTLVILTSNLGSRELKSVGGAIGFGARLDNAPASLAKPVLDAAQSELPPELWSRIDEHLVFMRLNESQIRQIAQLQLAECREHLFSEHEITLGWDAAVIDFLLGRIGSIDDLGARGMRQGIQRYVEAPIADAILGGDLFAGSLAHLEVAAGERIQVLNQSESRAS
jgi:ATP-dependent Clp protease ATP-binding subunit ClpC